MHAGWSFTAGLGLGLFAATAALFFFLVENWQTAIAGVLAATGAILAIIGSVRTMSRRERIGAPSAEPIDAEAN